MIQPLSEHALLSALESLPGWRWDGTRKGIVRHFAFADFGGAFAFMTRVAAIAQTLDHHPDWSNRWNKVDILLTTHDAGGLTDRDVEMARRIDAAAAKANPR